MFSLEWKPNLYSFRKQIAPGQRIGLSVTWNLLARRFEALCLCLALLFIWYWQASEFGYFAVSLPFIRRGEIEKWLLSKWYRVISFFSLSSVSTFQVEQRSGDDSKKHYTRYNSFGQAFDMTSHMRYAENYIYRNEPEERPKQKQNG